MARPEEYYPELCKKLIEFFEIPLFETRIKLLHKKNGDTEEIPYDVPLPLPTIEKFCAKYDLNKKTFHNWKKNHAELLHAYKRVKMFQFDHLCNNALMNHYSPSFAKFMAVNITKLRDKSEVDSKSSDGSMTPVYNFKEK